MTQGTAVSTDATTIAGAIARAYRDAEIAPAAEGVAPLDALIAGYPLHRDELPRLTKRRAMDFLRRRAGTDLPDGAGQASGPPGPDADEPLSGFLYVYPYESAVWGCVLVDQDDIIERRRFSAAHELGHYLLHFLPLMQDRLRAGEHLFLTEGFSLLGDEEDEHPGEARLQAGDATGAPLSAPLPPIERMEAEANRFAAELLMPESVCRQLYLRQRCKAAPRRLATDLLVSPAAMHLRLLALGLLS